MSGCPKVGLDPRLLIGKHRWMLISELIEELQSLQTQHGDIEVEARDNMGDFSDVESVLDEVTRHGITIRIDA
jgi:hypothetical protein